MAVHTDVRRGLSDEKDGRASIVRTASLSAT
jgi:hypothetical protein